MGVDSNVLIFERIREELRAGKTAGAGSGSGLCACLGHHRRYARHDHRLGGHSLHVRHRAGEGICVTLTFGLLANLFTAVFVSRVIFDSHCQQQARRALSI
jgi:preprotein translocase subunit SecD